MFRTGGLFELVGRQHNVLNDSEEMCVIGYLKERALSVVLLLHVFVTMCGNY
jgi:hypothetical protein